MKKNSVAKDAFFDWAYDTREVRARNSKIAWSLVFLFGFIAISALIALISLVPLKEKVPIVFTVDKNTGIIEQRTIVDQLNWTPNQARDYSNVSEYIISREGYFHPTYLKQYEKSVKSTAGMARSDLLSNFAPDKPRSNLLRYQDKTQVDIRFKSLTYHGSNNSVVIARFIADTKNSDGVFSNHYVATIQYEYVPNESLSLTSRLSNPDGFVVTSYQVSEEGFQNEG